MFNLLKNLPTQKITNFDNGISPPLPYNNTYELSRQEFSYETASFSEADNSAKVTGSFYERHQSKNKSLRNQEWLADLATITRTQIGDFRFSVEMLAREMALSRSQLFRKVKELLSISPNQFIREIRLEVAKELLESGQVTSIKTTAYKVGLKDVANFSKMFKERFGYLPSKYI